MSAQEAPQWIARATVASTACWAAVSAAEAPVVAVKERVGAESFGPVHRLSPYGDAMIPVSMC